MSPLKIYFPFILYYIFNLIFHFNFESNWVYSTYKSYYMHILCISKRKTIHERYILHNIAFFSAYKFAIFISFLSSFQKVICAVFQKINFFWFDTSGDIFCKVSESHWALNFFTITLLFVVVVIVAGCCCALRFVLFICKTLVWCIIYNNNSSCPLLPQLIIQYNKKVRNEWNISKDCKC